MAAKWLFVFSRLIIFRLFTDAGLAIVCAGIGMASAQSGDAAKPFVTFFKASADIILLLMQWLIK